MRVRELMHRDQEVFVRNVRCPCFCGGEGALVLMRCPECFSIVLVCDEVGSIFPDPHNLTAHSGSEHDPEARCPKCAQALMANFERATIDEAIATGFGRDGLDWRLAHEVLLRS